MKSKLGPGTRRLLGSCLLVAALGGRAFAQGLAASPAVPAALPTPGSPEPIGLEQFLGALESGAPSLKAAQLNLDAAAAQLALGLGKNGLSLAGAGGYAHVGDLPGVSSSGSSAAGSGRVIGDNVQAGLALSGPQTSLGLSAQQGIGTGGSQTTSLALSGSQVVYDGYPGGRPSGLSTQANYNYQIAKVAYDAALKTLSFQVKQAYYTLLGDQNSLVARQATLQAAQENLAQMQGYAAAGRATKLDVLQTQVALRQAQLDLASAQNTIEVDRRKLSLAVGWPLGKAYAVADVPAPQPPESEAQRALDAALLNRSELKTLDLGIGSAQVDLSLQKSQYAPTVSLNGSVNVAQDWTARSLYGGSFSAGATVALPPFYDGRQQASAVRQKADQLGSLKVQRDQEGLSIGIEVQGALFSVRDTNDRLGLAGQNLEQAQGVYDMQKARFAAGLATTLDVMTAFSALAAAQVGLEQAKSAYNLAVLNLDNAMGL